jgi:pimeloyl-ACP methyl ester carboxylesterase
MNGPTTNTLTVPGATLYYEVRGAGPVLLLIPGGNGDAGPFERVANALAGRYTVASYDRRGFSRSPLNEPPDDRRRLDTDIDDAIHLLDHLTDDPAYVFGSSSGAIVALNLMARHPDRVRIVVAHEPPLAPLLPDAEAHLEFLDEVYETYRHSGVDSAMQKFNAGIGQHVPQLPQGMELPPQVVDMVSRIQRNFAFWLEHELRQYPRAVPDLAALEAVSTRVVLAGGRGSREHFPYRPNLILAERLSREVVDFPGDHIGYVTYPADFAAQLADLLTVPGQRRS